MKVLRETLRKLCRTNYYNFNIEREKMANREMVVAVDRKWASWVVI